MPRSSPDRLRERGEVITELEALLERAAGGHGGTLFLLGEGGVGKTSLLDEAAVIAQGRFAVGRARGYAMEQDLPYAVAAEALESLGDGDVVGQPAAAVDPGAAQAQVLTRTRAWLEDKAVQQPVLLLLDDLHAADSDSLALIRFVCRRLAHVPLAVVASARPWPAGGVELAQQLMHDGAARSTAVLPLSRPTAVELLAQRSGIALAGKQAERAWELTAGNPLLIEQLGTSLRAGGVVPAGDIDDLPELRRALLLAYTAQLPPTALAVALAAAVLGDRFRIALLGQVADLTDVEAADALAVCEQAGLVHPAGAGTMEFVHPLIDQALRDDLPEGQRAALHARAFAVLDDAGDTAAAAGHALAADLAGDQRAIAVAQAAGEQALAAGAPRTAIARLEGAVRLAGAHAPPSLLASLAVALLSAGEVDDALEVTDRLLGNDGLPAAFRATVLRLRGWALTSSARYAAAVAALVEAQTLVDDPGVVTDRAVIEFYGYGPRAAAVTLARPDPAVDGIADLRRAAAAGAAAMHLGEAGELDVLEEAARAQAAGTLPLERAGVGEPLMIFGPLVTALERFDDEGWAYAEGARVAEESGAPLAQVMVAMGHAHALWRQGRFVDAQRLLDDIAPLSELAPQMELFVGLNRVLVAESVGDREHARSLRDGLEEEAETAGWLGRLWLRYIDAELALADGQVKAACAAADEARAIAFEVGLGEPCLVPWAGVAARAWLAKGRLDDAADLAGWLESTSAGLPCRWPRAVAVAIRAQLAGRHGDTDEAERGFADALGLLADVDLPVERIHVLLAAGRTLSRAGRRRHARGHLAEALAVAERVGASGLVAQAEIELGLAGGRRRNGRAPSELTPAQARVAELAAGGATTQEIADALVVSPRTVESHLARVYDKVGVRSRRELTAAFGAAASDR